MCHDKNDDSAIEDLMCGETYKLIMELCKSKSTKIAVVSSKLLGSIAGHRTDNSNELIANGILPIAKLLLDHQSQHVRYQGVFLLSNLLAGSRESIEKIIAAQLVAQLLKMLTMEDFRVQTTPSHFD
jgi:hypothetical protein